MKKRVLFVATVVKGHISVFHLPFLKMFKEMGWETAVAARNDYENPDECIIPYCDTYYDIPFERNPIKVNNVRAFALLREIINKNNYDIIHCHTPVGAMVTRLSALQARKKGSKVVYTAHGFHFYRGAPIINWVLYYPVERLLAHFTDALITINKEDFVIANTFRTNAVYQVPGVGIDVSKFIKKEERQEKRLELEVRQDDFVLLSVGELSMRKNHMAVIRALALLKEQKEFERIQYLICGRGVLKEKLRKEAEVLGVGEHVHFLGYRTDIPDICSSSDLFVFMSLQEGLPVALMEAMGCGLPIICSNIRGNTDLISDDVEGRVVNNNPVLIADAILDMMIHEEKRDVYVQAAGEKLVQYSLENVLTKMQSIYENTLEGE